MKPVFLVFLFIVGVAQISDLIADGGSLWNCLRSYSMYFSDIVKCISLIILPVFLFIVRVAQFSDLIADGRSLRRRHGEAAAAEAIHFAGNPEDRERFGL